MICLLVCFYGEVVGRSYEILSMQQEFYHKKKINISPSDLAMLIHQFSATLKFSYIGPCAAGRDLDFQSWFKAKVAGVKSGPPVVVVMEVSAPGRVSPSGAGTNMLKLLYFETCGKE